MSGSTPSRLFAAAEACLRAADPAEKVRLTAETARRWETGELALEPAGPLGQLGEPGRPERPVLVHPRELPGRGLGTVEGRAALIHAVAHIEFNAINLAWDAVWRFRGLPLDYYGDWVQVAAEEAYHFGLMRERLQALGYDYGDFAAHDGLWAMARRTASDPLERMALVPRVMEARGLDVTPGMIERFRAAGDEDTVARLGVILRDEVGHVAAGSRWFRHLCAERGLPPEATYFALLETYLGGEVRGPINRAERRRAGFDEAELRRLGELVQRGSRG